MNPDQPPNPIDAVVSAGRLFGSVAPALVPVIFLLEAVKAALVLGPITAFGEDIGASIGGLAASALLTMIVGVGVLVAVDAHDGYPPRSPGALLRDAAPYLVTLGLLGLFLAAVAGWLAMRLGLPASTAMLFGVGAAGLTPWLASARRNETPGLELKASFARAGTLATAALLPAACLLLLQLFSLELIPALADSAVGRKAPLGVWIPVESLISGFITPLVAMAIATLFLQLDDALPATPATPAPPMPSGGPSLLKPQP